MLPVKEKGGTAYFTRMYHIAVDRPAKARELGTLMPGVGASFYGRGFLQFTRRSNYRRATSRLHDLGMLQTSTDLQKRPDVAMEPNVAACILYVGTRESWLTGAKLSPFFCSGKADWTGARRIISGQDHATEIGLHAKAFQAAFIKAGYLPGAIVYALPVPAVTTQPLPPLVPVSPRPLEPAPPQPLPPPKPLLRVTTVEQPNLLARILDRLRAVYHWKD